MKPSPPNAGNPQPVRPQIVPEYVIACAAAEVGRLGPFIVFLVVLGLLASLALNVILGGAGLIGFSGAESEARVARRILLPPAPCQRQGGDPSHRRSHS